ncbi:MAG: TonB family protein [Chlorobi bacterium]|nr:TonB family protein [Chlorobiota bacterium]
MALFRTPHERKAFMESLVVMIILIALMFVSGLTYLDPPPPGNIAINFGTSEHGSGRVQPPKPVKAAPNPVESVPAKTEKILTDENSDAPVVKPQKQEKKKKKKAVKPKKQKPKPSSDAKNALDNLFNASESGNEGDDENLSGDMGSTEGDVNATGRTGNGKGGGGGIDGNYFLGNRKALTKPKPQYNCNETGRVTVIIKVNRQGKVTEAYSGPGTTGSSCLIQAAIKAAYKTRWEPSEKAEDEQVGKIIYEFKLQ